MTQDNSRNLPDKFEPYQPNNVPLFESLYGKNLISMGGTASIENMFSDINIKGLRALDLGFGLGGVAFYLAKKYEMNITGIEIHSWMAQYAKDHVPSDIANNVIFDTYKTQDILPYHSNVFDLVYSKGVLNHVLAKENLFRQVFSVLKMGGLFVIADWIYPNIPEDNSELLVCETQDSYQQVLIKSGFDEIIFRNDSEIFLAYVQTLLKNISKNQDFIVSNFGENLFLIIRKQHEDLLEKIINNKKIAVRISAKKSQ